MSTGVSQCPMCGQVYDDVTDCNCSFMESHTPPAPKPREFWIEFGGDPSNDQEVYKRYSSTRPFEPGTFSDEVIHVVEKSAYDALANKLDEANLLLRTALEAKVEMRRRIERLERALAYAKRRMADHGMPNAMIREIEHIEKGEK